MLNTLAVRPRLRPDSPLQRTDTSDSLHHTLSPISPASSTAPLLSSSIGADSASEASSLTAVELQGAAIATPPWATRQARGAWISAFALGAAHGGLKARMPELKNALRLDDQTLGLAFGAAACARLPGTFAAAPLTRTIGARSAQALVALSVPLSVAAVAASQDLIEALPILALIGMTSALDETLIATAASTAEGQRSSAAQSHALNFASIGALVGGGVAAAAAHIKLPLFNHLLTAGLALALLGLCGAQLVCDDPNLEPHAERDLEGNLTRATPTHAPHEESLFVLRTSVALRLAGIGLAASFAEATLYDWSSIYLRDALGTDAAFAAAGYACVVGSMATTRLALAPRLSQRSARAVIVGAGTLAALTGAFTLTSTQPNLALIGLSAAGACLGVIEPRLSLELSLRCGKERTAAVTTLATGRSAGALIAPPIVGLLAGRYGLAKALLTAPVAAALAAAIAIGRLPKPESILEPLAPETASTSGVSERTLAHQSGVN